MAQMRSHWGRHRFAVAAITLVVVFAGSFTAWAFHDYCDLTVPASASVAGASVSGHVGVQALSGGDTVAVCAGAGVDAVGINTGRNDAIAVRTQDPEPGSIGNTVTVEHGQCVNNGGAVTCQAISPLVFATGAEVFFNSAGGPACVLGICPRFRLNTWVDGIKFCVVSFGVAC